jgi:SAM-dependent methyltransferase
MTMKSVKSWWQGRYASMKASALGAAASEIPAEYRSSFVSYGGAREVQHIIGRMVPKSAKRVLVIGVFGGRDYFLLKSRGGHEVHALDLEVVPGFDNFKVGNVEERLPYGEKYFDAIVMNEVLEHLIEDARALGNLRAALKDDGVLVLSVPFVHDAEPTHVRVHTRASVERLLACCGFEAFDVVERPGLGFYLPGVNAVNHLASLVLHATTGRTLYNVTMPLIARFEDWAGKRPNRLRRLSPSWGAFLACRKIPTKFDHVSHNAKTFWSQAPNRRATRARRRCAGGASPRGRLRARRRFGRRPGRPSPRGRGLLFRGRRGSARARLRSWRRRGPRSCWCLR